MATRDGSKQISAAVDYLKKFDLLFHAKIEVHKHYKKHSDRPVYRRPDGKLKLGQNDEIFAGLHYLVQELYKQKNKSGISEPLASQVWAIYFFHFPVNVYDKKSNSFYNLSSLMPLVDEALEKSGLIESASQLCAYDWSRRLRNDKNPSTYELEIMLLSFSNTELQTYTKPEGILVI